MSRFSLMGAFCIWCVSRDLSVGGVFVERSSQDLCRRRQQSGRARELIDFFLDNQRPQFVAINSDRARVTPGKISSAPK